MVSKVPHQDDLVVLLDKPSWGVAFDKDDTAPASAPGGFDNEILVVTQRSFKCGDIAVMLDHMVQRWGWNLMHFCQLLCFELVIHEREEGSGIGTHDVFGVPAIHTEDSDLSEPVDGLQDRHDFQNLRKRKGSKSR